MHLFHKLHNFNILHHKRIHNFYSEYVVVPQATALLLFRTHGFPALLSPSWHPSRPCRYEPMEFEEQASNSFLSGDARRDARILLHL